LQVLGLQGKRSCWNRVQTYKAKNGFAIRNCGSFKIIKSSSSFKIIKSSL